MKTTKTRIPPMLEFRGPRLFLGKHELGEVYRGSFRPSAYGRKLELFWAQGERRTILEYVSDHLLRTKRIDQTQWRKARANYRFSR